MKTILFICTHNSARSQLAEALTNHHFGARWQASSAGTEQTRVKPQAIAVLQEAGIHTASLRSKTVEEFAGQQFDVVVTVCDSAQEACPFFPGKRVVHHSFNDPSNASDAEKLAAFRASRDEILAWLYTALPQWEV